jgi:hypothetical protein
VQKTLKDVDTSTCIVTPRRHCENLLSTTHEWSRNLSNCIPILELPGINSRREAAALGHRSGFCANHGKRAVCKIKALNGRVHLVANTVACSLNMIGLAASQRLFISIPVLL